jgi:hypothetical protein
MTLPVPGSQAGEEASVFLSFEFTQMARAAGTLTSSGPLVQLVRHPSSRRGAAGPLDSPLSEHALHAEDVASTDSVLLEDGSKVPASWHKLGGAPYVIDAGPEMAKAVQTAFSDSYFHYLQLDFPGDRDAQVSGDWPFGDGMFHVLARRPFLADDWLFFWEF